jgi:hypothetical protein
MLLVLSSIADQHAQAGVAHWRAKGATAELITCHDVAQAGWKLSLDDDAPTFVVGGKPVAAKDIDGILTRLAYVTVFELPFIHAEDREYAASEIQAFLLALLAGLKCPVLNAPRPGSLNGPAWTPEQWTRCAAKAGTPVRPAIRRAYAGGVTIVEPIVVDPRVVNVVGDDAFGDAPAALKKQAVAIAKAAEVDLLRVTFDVRSKPAVFLDADAWVDISDKTIAEAIRKRLA